MDADTRTDAQHTGTPADTDRQPEGKKPAAPGAEPRSPEAEHALLEPQAAEEFRAAWRDIQSGFVDHPKDSVQAADALVAEVMRTLARSFTAHKTDLEHQWAQGGDVETEDLRVALQRYRSFFNRLLTT